MSIMGDVDKKYPCEVCGVEYTAPQALGIHRSVKHGIAGKTRKHVKKVRCVICHQWYDPKYLRYEHMPNAHGQKDNLPVRVAMPVSVSNGKVELHDEPDLIIRVDQHGDPWICRKVNLA